MGVTIRWSKAAPLFPAQGALESEAADQPAHLELEGNRGGESVNYNTVILISNISSSIRLIVDVIWPKFEGLIQ